MAPVVGDGTGVAPTVGDGAGVALMVGEGTGVGPIVGDGAGVAAIVGVGDGESVMIGVGDEHGSALKLPERKSRAPLRVPNGRPGTDAPRPQDASVNAATATSNELLR